MSVVMSTDSWVRTWVLLGSPRPLQTRRVVWRCASFSEADQKLCVFGPHLLCTGSAYSLRQARHYPWVCHGAKLDTHGVVGGWQYTGVCAPTHSHWFGHVGVSHNTTVQPSRPDWLCGPFPGAGGRITGEKGTDREKHREQRHLAEPWPKASWILKMSVPLRCVPCSPRLCSLIKWPRRNSLCTLCSILPRGV